MSVIKLTPDQLAETLQHHQEQIPAAIQGGVLLAAHRGRALLVKRSPVDQGVYKNSWQVRSMGAIGALLFNDAPHAGIIEQGARPHAVSREGIEAIKAWAKRKLVLTGPAKAPRLKMFGLKIKRPRRSPGAGSAKSGKWALQDWADEEATRIAFAIAAKLKKEGQRGLFLVANAMPDIVEFLKQEIDRRVKATLEGK